MKNNPLTIVFAGSKKVAIIGAKGLPPEFFGTSGVEFYLSERLLLLARAGIDVVCYVRTWATPADTTTYKHAVLIRLPSIATMRLDAVSHSLLSTIHACFSDADTVWYQATGPAMFSFLPRFFRKRVFVTIHALEWKREKWSITAKIALKCSEWMAALAAHKVIVVSRPLADYWTKTYHTEVVIDAPIAMPVKSVLPDIIRKKYGLQNNGYILYLGRFVPEKRLEWLIMAFQKIPNTRFRLVLAGGAHHMDGYAANLRVLAQKDKRILFVGWVFGKEKEELLANCRLFVLPSSLEGNPTVLYELPSDRMALVSKQVARSVVRQCNLVVFSDDSEQGFVKKLHNHINDVKMSRP